MFPFNFSCYLHFHFFAMEFRSPSNICCPLGQTVSKHYLRQVKNDHETYPRYIAFLGDLYIRGRGEWSSQGGIAWGIKKRLGFCDQFKIDLYYACEYKELRKSEGWFLNRLDKIGSKIWHDYRHKIYLLSEFPLGWITITVFRYS